LLVGVFISAHSCLPSWEIGGAENKEMIEGEQILRTNVDWNVI
jgi:hypothetical protein